MFLFIDGFITFSLLLFVKYTLFWTYLWQLKEYRFDRMRDFLFSPEGRKVYFSKLYILRVVFILLIIISTLTLRWLYKDILILKGITRIKYEIFNFIFYLSKDIISNFTAYLLLFYYFFLILLCLSIIVEITYFISKILRGKNIIAPDWTPRAKLTFLLSFLFILIFPISQFPNFPISFLIPLILSLIILSPLLVSLVVIITMPFAVAVKYYIRRRAKNHRRKFKNLITIGITGSYGKTTVKEFIAQILASKFKVLKTEKNINSEIGIAQTILKKLTPKQQIFVCEMGAYRRGEIKKSAQIAQPQIAVMTGICQQHLSLFGSLENIIAAKSELISSLPKNGIVFLNYDSQNVRQIKIPAHCQKITYGIGYRDADLKAEKIGVSWRLSVKENKEIMLAPAIVKVLAGRLLGKLGNWEIGKLGNLSGETAIIKQEWKLEVGNLLGKHNILNLLPAIVIALAMGMEKEEVEQAIKQIHLPEGTMRFIKKDNLILIDDTYNANPEGVKAALEILEYYKIEIDNGVSLKQNHLKTQPVALESLDNKTKKRPSSISIHKILVLDDILELGSEAKRIHQEIGEQVAKMNLSKIILVGKNYAEFLRKILIKSGIKEEQIIIYKTGMNIKNIFNNQKAIILFEGRRAKNVLDLI